MEGMVKHNNAIEELRRRLRDRRFDLTQKAKFKKDIDLLEVSRHELSRRRAGEHLVERIKLVLKIAVGIVDTPKYPDLALWPDFMEEQLSLLSIPNTKRPPSWIADQIARLIDSIEGRCLSKDDRNLLIALGALMLRDKKVR